jgi:hypothetical protein
MSGVKPPDRAVVEMGAAAVGRMALARVLRLFFPFKAFREVMPVLGEWQLMCTGGLVRYWREDHRAVTSSH